MLEYTFKVLVHFTQKTLKRFQTDMYWEDLHIYFLVTFHTVSTIAFKGGFICPSLCLRVLHPFFWSFSGQIECICRRLQCILHKERVVLSLFFDWIFLMHARFFRRSPTHFGSIEHLIWHFFFFFQISYPGQNVPAVCLFYQLTKKKHITTSVFVLHTENWISCFLQPLCCYTLLLYVAMIHTDCCLLKPVYF